MSVVLRPTSLQWIRGTQEDPNDLCAHGDFEFRIGADVLADGTGGRTLTLSAAALYLLRTLSGAHTKAASVGDHLFPCCGFGLYDAGDGADVVVVGCPSGQDFEVEPVREGVCIRAEDGREWCVASVAWRTAVFVFADAVSAFYSACARKQPTAADAPGFRSFAAEWLRRRGLPLSRWRPEQRGRAWS